MRFIDICRQGVERHGAQLIRPTKGRPGEYDAKPYFTGNKRGWVCLDAFSASAVVSVHDALNETNRAKFAATDPLRAISIAFKLIAKAS